MTRIEPGKLVDEEIQGSDHLDVPAPTHWPLVAALGVTLGFAGLITNFLVTLAGVAFAVAGAIGWWHEVLPRERRERVGLRPPSQRAAPVQPRPEAVDHLVVGKGHRVRLPVEVHPYSAGLLGGLAGAVAMAAVALVYGMLAYDSVWYPINLLAAVAVPSFSRASVQQLGGFSGLGLGVAAVIHLITSLFMGLLYAVILPMLPARRGPIWGGLLGPLLWSGLLWALLGVIDPLLSDRIDWRWFIASQVAFGLVVGVVLARSKWIETRQTWPLAARLGIEARGVGPQDGQNT